MLGVNRATARDAVAADELIADLEAARGRDARPKGRLEGRLPETALGERRAVVLRIGVLGAEDAKAREVVAHRDRDRALDPRMLPPAGDLGERNVAGREIDLVDAREHQLQGAALGADHQVEAAGIAQEAVLELGAEQQQQHDRTDPQRQQDEIERGVERTRADIGETQREQAHDRLMGRLSARRSSKCGARR